jgi:murein DD-endopeptidase MepM/ murein hydrolase activator NlpD
MHTLNRLVTLAICAMLLVPAGTYALVSLQDRQEATDSLHQALDNAVKSYRSRSGLQSLQTKGQKTIAAEGKRLAQISVRQRQLRDEILSLRATVAKIQSRYSVKIESASGAAALMAEEKKTFAAAVRSVYVRRLSDEQTEDDPGRTLVRVSLMEAPGFAAAPMRIAEVTELHTRYLSDLSLVAKTFKRLAMLSSEREELLAERLHADRSFTGAQQIVELSAEQMKEIANIMNDVHDQVLKMQGELARIDARLRAKAERALIEKGLLDPLNPGDGTMAQRRPTFSWPAYGSISAGFMNAAYKKYFGVPHYGMDIVVGQGTPIAAASDGVVFLVREGGATGYTYILIGHRNGYATLYGHLSETLVQAGQEVAAGQTIGLSGGKPGTNGAGPMTTGPHLHFEVIERGVNIDPKGMLP